MSYTAFFRKHSKWALLGICLFQNSQAFAWGQTGHRVTANIAEQYLSADAKAKIAAIYPTKSLAEISTLADEMRSDPSEFWQKTSSPWHYVSVPEGSDYSAAKHAPSQGDAYTALLSFSATLKNPEATLQDKQLALHFIVHIIGDLHQPLHAGDGTDRGGNDVKLEFFWENSNLHRVWDSGIIDRQQLSFTEWTNWLSQKISPEMAKQWQTTDPRVWIKESIQLRNNIYPQEEKLSWSYQYQHLPEVKQRLQMGGVRIAAYLNSIL
ncbi:S1/P1 nuclease [Aliiglaciecola sp. 2_MG-2023]|uniref:S1/P1 nuclease n=1 Tax=unclassified Aliiglaciecola TaxID=2593648 RepID=UPI0026E2D2BD|nr:MULTISPECIES: S1/P1 nuclease [unclassified Aliiglaciecola]MDO6712667.1 S1/P1 nuclease [Aliiglaciecola sp. 2_MG-2023]MDO6754390.1 S1/P1 nuclease [Aliiglaciecola sp. 1_MG-2023]